MKTINASQFGRESAIAQGNSIQFLQSDEFIAEGIFRDSIDLDPGPGTLIKHTSPMFWNGYLLKMRMCTPSFASVTASSCIAYTSPSGNHTWTASGVYMDTLLNHTGCDSIATFHITIHTPLGFLPAITGNAPVCEGSTNTYSVPADPNVSSYFWMLPGGWSGNSTTNSITTIAGGGSGTVFVQASNSCGSSNTANLGVNVNPLPTPGFTSTSNQLVAAFTNTSLFAFTWSWDFGDGNTSTLQNPTHTYASPGTYNVCLTASDNSCAATICHMVTVVTVSSLDADVLGVSIFPNPSAGMFRLECKEGVLGKLFDAQGKILAEANYASGSHVIDLTALADGVFMLMLSNESTSQCVKLLKMTR